MAKKGWALRDDAAAAGVSLIYISRARAVDIPAARRLRQRPDERPAADFPARIKISCYLFI